LRVSIKIHTFCLYLHYQSSLSQICTLQVKTYPLRVMETASKGYALLAEMAEKGNPASISDVGVGLLSVHACIEGAAMNVRINLAGLKDQALSASLREKMQRLASESGNEFKRLHAIVQGKLG